MFEADFENLLSRYADAIPDRARFSGLLKDYFPGQQMQINLLMNAYNLGLASEIEGVKVINQAFAYRFVKRLADDYGVSRVNADWAVAEWCVVYGQRVLKKPCEISLPSVRKGAAPAIKEEKPGALQYGDLFTYEKSSGGTGLSVTGFHGKNQSTIIFQNSCKGLPVVEVKDGAFSGKEVEEAILTDGYRRIGNRSFMGCTKLHQMILPYSVKVLGDYCLAGCAALSSIALPRELGEIGACAFSDSGIKNIQIPTGVYYIGEGAFSGCRNLEKIEILKNISDIPRRMLKGCAGLKKVTLHDTLNSIGDEAFYGCIGLTTIYVPDSVRSIGEHSFEAMDKKFILQCSYGSYAEEYARKRKMKYQLV